MGGEKEKQKRRREKEKKRKKKFPQLGLLSTNMLVHFSHSVVSDPL